MENPMKLPILGQVAAGSPVEWLPITQWRDVRPPKHYHWTKRYLRLEAVGDSMSPFILNGDVIIFEIAEQAKEGEMVVVLTPGGLICKYLHYTSGQLLRRSHNPAYDDQVFEPEEVLIRGIVRRIERDVG
jgi:SOS-response transcriptional repressor LexA